MIVIEGKIAPSNMYGTHCFGCKEYEYCIELLWKASWMDWYWDFPPDLP